MKNMSELEVRAYVETIKSEVIKSATREVEYMPLKHAIKAVNLALEKCDKKLVSPNLKGELCRAGFGKFCIGCLDFFNGVETLALAPKPGESDWAFIHAKVDALGRPCYSVRQLVKCFEYKFGFEFKAYNDEARAIKERVRAEKAEARAEKKAKKEAENAEIISIAVRGLEAQLNRELTIEEMLILETGMSAKKHA